MRPLWARQGWTGEDPSVHPAFLVLGRALGASFLQPGLRRGEAWVTLPPRKVLEALRILREEPSLRFNVLSDLTAVHWPDLEKPFEVVYQLYSIPHRSRYRVKVPLGEGEEIPTATGLWKAAEWMEREVFDLFGIPFAGHPDLRRILNPEDFEGHPLRKDFPLLGKAER